MSNSDDNLFWGEPTPTDLYDDLKKLDTLYEELMWDHDDELQFYIDGGRIVIRNLTLES